MNKEGVAKDKIVILSDRRKENSVLSGVEEVAGYQLDDIYDDASDVIQYRTIQSFKGLEADIIIFINHTYKNEPQTERKRSLLYTALTRARFFVYCLDYIETVD